MSDDSDRSWDRRAIYERRQVTTMSDEFAETWLYEAGEAIGNVGRRVLRRRNRGREAEQALQRWLRIVPAPVIPPTRQGQSQPDEDVIDAVYRIVDDQKGAES
jgi:hypothetical protein